ncbi:MAG TPA: iron uptake transporter deferrochelatase/peroxidase subunit [Solirubrobacteraceae bacterium]|nr:iron uptake transporter deferrochelatase/peroxidase subunit [Solirubrobacteraceae bacterium]
MKRATRRGFLTSVGLAGAGLGLRPAVAPAAPVGTAARAGAVSFFGPHQAGIATPTQEHVQFAGLDLLSSSADDLRGLLALLSGAAADLCAGRPVGALQTGETPPVDTGEAVGLSAARLTVTFGLGPSIFAPGRFGLAPRRPAPLVDLPAFANDALEDAISGGDLALQVCAEDPQVAFHAVHDLIRLAQPLVTVRWLLAGFGRTSNSRRQQTPRNLMGFKDGTANIVSEDTASLSRFVWANGPESPPWMQGGSYMVVRRIKMLLDRWDGIGLNQQEDTFGRHKLSGAPLGEAHEYDPLDLRARRDGRPVIPFDAHVRLASPAENSGQRILRRGYSYVEPIEGPADAVAGGQLFICYQRDPRRQFIPIQRRLAASDALNAHTAHVGSAIFACPPGIGPGGYVGQPLLG